MSVEFLFVIASGFFLAFANGANDNFKGTATLVGSGTVSYKKGLAWATITTFLGSITAFFLAQKLMGRFSGKGIVPDDIATLTSYSTSVAMASAATVFLAARLGFPISTTHALTGALIGAGWLASPVGVDLHNIFSYFFLPLLLSPLLAVVLTSTIYPLLSQVRKWTGINRQSCLCIGQEIIAPAPVGSANGFAPAQITLLNSYPSLTIDTRVTCEKRYMGSLFGVQAKTILDSLHFLSSGLVSFARGLNDTPKIAALLLCGGSLGSQNAVFVTSIAIGLGGLLMSRRVAKTMSEDITSMNDGQGFSANFITSMTVLMASSLSLPVSTTHVSCGALFGLGAVTGQAHWTTVFKILAAWVVTLPMAGALGMGFLYLTRSLQ